MKKFYTQIYSWIVQHATVLGVVLAVAGLAYSMFDQPSTSPSDINVNSPQMIIEGGKNEFQDIVVVGNNNTVTEISNKIALKLQQIQISHVGPEVNFVAQNVFQAIDKEQYQKLIDDGVSTVLNLQSAADQAYRQPYQNALQAASDYGDVTQIVFILEEAASEFDSLNSSDERFSLHKIYNGLGAFSLTSDLDQSIDYFAAADTYGESKNALGVLDKLLNYRDAPRGEQSTAAEFQSEPPAPSSSSASGTITNVGNGYHVKVAGYDKVIPSNPRGLRDEFARYPSFSSRLFGFEPIRRSYEENSTEYLGYSVNSKVSPLILNDLGILEGDIVTIVNGIDLKDQKAGIKALRSIIKSEHITMKILRDGKEVTVEISLLM